MKNLRYVGYALCVIYCLLLLVLAFGGSGSLSIQKTFDAQNCEKYLEFHYNGYMGGGNTLTLSNFYLKNKSKRTLKNLKIYGRANAEASVYEVAEIKPAESIRMKFVVHTQPKQDIFDSFFGDIEFWAEGEIE